MVVVGAHYEAVSSNLFERSEGIPVSEAGNSFPCMFHARIEQYIYFSFQYVVFSSNDGSEFSIDILLD